MTDPDEMHYTDCGVAGGFPHRASDCSGSDHRVLDSDHLAADLRTVSALLQLDKVTAPGSSQLNAAADRLCWLENVTNEQVMLIEHLEAKLATAMVVGLEIADLLNHWVECSVYPETDCPKCVQMYAAESLLLKWLS